MRYNFRERLSAGDEQYSVAKGQNKKEVVSCNRSLWPLGSCSGGTTGGC